MINLRNFNAADETLLIRYLNDEDVTRYVTAAIPKPYTSEDAKWWVEQGCKEEWIRAVEADGKLVGCVSATVGQFEYKRSAELGYWIAKPFWGRGYATEAVRQLSEEIYKSSNVERLFVSVVKENYGSIRVLEKNGFVTEGVMKKASFKDGQFYDECLMAKVSQKF